MTESMELDKVETETRGVKRSASEAELPPQAPRRIKAGSDPHR